MAEIDDKLRRALDESVKGKQDRTGRTPVDLLTDTTKSKVEAARLQDAVAAILPELSDSDESSWRILREITRSTRPIRSGNLIDALLLLVRTKKPASVGARIYAHLMLKDLHAPVSMKVLMADKVLRERNPQEWLDFAIDAIDPPELHKLYIKLAPGLSGAKIARRLPQLRRLYQADYFRLIRELIEHLPSIERNIVSDVYKKAYAPEIFVDQLGSSEHQIQIPALNEFYNRANAHA